MVKSWGFIPESVKPLALAVGAGRWGEAVAGCRLDVGSSGRRALASLAGDTRDVALAGAVARLADDADPAVRCAMERALVVQALAATRMSLPPSALFEGEANGDVRRAIDEGLVGDERVLAGAIASAAGTGRRGVMLALICLMEPRNRLRARRAISAETRDEWSELGMMVGDPSHAAHEPLKSVLRWSPAPLVRVRALEWLAINATASVAAERLARAATFAEHELVLRRAHLLERPKRRVRAGVVPLKTTQDVKGLRVTRDGALPRGGIIPLLSADARRGLPRFAAAIKGDAPSRRAALEPLLADSDPSVRHAAARYGPTTLAADLCLDPDARVAASAFLRWSCIGAFAGRPGASASDPARAAFTRLLHRSPHALVREWSGRESGALPDPDAETIAGRLVCQELFAADRETFLEELKGAIRGGEGPACVRAIMRVRRMGLHFHAERELERAASSPDAAAAATAVAALGELKTSGAALAASAAHADPRVRANAVDAIAQVSRFRGQPAGVLVDLKPLQQDDHHRVRANALRAMIVGRSSVRPEPACADGLAAMLSDEREMHRLAGVWAAQRLMPAAGRARLGERWNELAARVSELAKLDPDDRVRRRAAACAARLSADFRAEWRDTAAGARA